jgi:hypothetical protein
MRLRMDRVDVDVIGVVIAPVIVAVHLNVNATVEVIGSVDDQGSIILVSIATTRSSSSVPSAYCAPSINSSIFITSR